MNRLLLVLVGVVLALYSGSAFASEFARSANFIVLADDADLAAEVLVQAERYRRQIAEEWLGEALPDGIGAAMINVRISAIEDSGLTWATDPASARRYHRVWLTTSSPQATGAVLKHELTHVVLATWMPQRLPPWAEEGAASRYDDASRVAQRRRALEWFARSGNWPRLIHVLEDDTIAADDLASYAVAASLSEFLLQRGDKATLLRFAAAGRRLGWDETLRTHYRIEDVDALQLAWQAHLSEQAASAE
jgi:hypothetical protein